MNLGDLRKIKANTLVWSIALQEMVRFNKDIIVEVTNKIYGEDHYFFGQIKLLLFEHTIPELVDKTNGELGPLDYRETDFFKMPRGILDKKNQYEK